MEENRNKDMPMGFCFSLAQNEKAMETFSSLSDEEKRTVIEASRQQKSKEKMQQFVDRLGDNFM